MSDEKQPQRVRLRIDDNLRRWLIGKGFLDIERALWERNLGEAQDDAIDCAIRKGELTPDVLQELGTPFEIVPERSQRPRATVEALGLGGW